MEKINPRSPVVIFEAVKKKELLKHFGSVKKIQEATIEELLQVKGINEKIAKELKKQLKEE